ncbi:VOC family protein [Nocardia sp. NPDC048505]|uniref:VOC family protein n=1 Tax=unclassified Nocardia TaxID=2637762 RepID=UPI003411AA08
MGAIARIGAVSLVGRDPIELGRFYRELLDSAVLFESPELMVLRGDGVTLTIGRVKDHRPPEWAATDEPQLAHLELHVADLDEAEGRAVELGAVRAERQPEPEHRRVLLDPAGHPFALTVPALRM